VFSAVVWGEYGFEFDFSDDEDKGKSLCKRRFNSIQFYLNTEFLFPSFSVIAKFIMLYFYGKIYQEYIQ